jgi:uncharacterized protein
MPKLESSWAKTPWRYCTLALLLAIVCSWAVADVAVPPFQNYVTDLAGSLNPQQRATLEQSLRAFSSQKGSQIAVLLVPSTAPETIEQYSIRVADNWKLGRKGVDDGALLLVAVQDHALRIEVGYGLEGVIPDAVANRIIDEVIVPYFKRGDYFGGIQAGVHQLMRLIQGEPLPAPSQRDTSWEGLQGMLPLVLMGTVVAGFILRRIFGRLVGASLTAGVAGLIGWLLFGSLLFGILIGLFVFFFVVGGGMGRPPGYGGWGYPSSGGGWGGGGGGISGGGGGFGGGGASGRW